MRRECRMAPLQIPVRRHKEFCTPVKARSLKPRRREIEGFIEATINHTTRGTSFRRPHQPSALQRNPCKSSSSSSPRLNDEKYCVLPRNTRNWNLLNVPSEKPLASPSFAEDATLGLLRTKSRHKSAPLAPLGDDGSLRQEMSVEDALFLYKEWKVFCESKLDDGLMDPWKACDRFLSSTQNLRKILESSKMSKIKTTSRLYSSLRSIFQSTMRTDGPLADAHNAIHNMLFAEEQKRVVTFAEALRDGRREYQISLPVPPHSPKDTPCGPAQVPSPEKGKHLPGLCFTVRSPEKSPREPHLLHAPASPTFSNTSRHHAGEVEAQDVSHSAVRKDTQSITHVAAAISEETQVLLTAQAAAAKSPRTKSPQMLTANTDATKSPRKTLLLPPPVQKPKGAKLRRVCPIHLPWWSKLYYIPQRRHELPTPTNLSSQTSFSNAKHSKTSFSRDDKWLFKNEQLQKKVNQTATSYFPHIKRCKTSLSRDEDCLSAKEQSENSLGDIARTASMMSRSQSCHTITKAPQCPLPDYPLAELDAFPPSTAPLSVTHQYMDDVITPVTSGDDLAYGMTQTIMTELDGIFKDIQRKGVRTAFRDRPMALVTPLQILDAETSGTIKEGLPTAG